MTDKEANIVSDITDVIAESWIVNNPTAMKNEKGEVTGYKATVATKDERGNLLDTGITIYSGTTTDSDKNTTSNGVWSSKSYQQESAKAEADGKKK